MAYHQNTSVDSAKLILGNYKIETSASSGGTFVNLGAGMVSKFGHNITMYKTQAGNAPDPVEGVADETFTIDCELIEYDASVLSAISGGAISADTTSSSVQTVINGGGNSVITDRAFRLTNTRIISGATKTTVILTYKAHLTAGLQFTAKSDNDADPITIMPIAIEAKVDSTRSAGSQLFSITKTV
jgi:hypothetical protein